MLDKYIKSDNTENNNMGISNTMNNTMSNMASNMASNNKINPAIYNIFSKECLVKVKEKLKKLYLDNRGSNTKKPPKYTLFELFKYEPHSSIPEGFGEGKNKDLDFYLYNIFTNDSHFEALESLFFGNISSKKEVTEFYRNNQVLIKNQGQADKCFKMLDNEVIVDNTFKIIGSFIQKEEISVADFSCAEDISQTKYRERIINLVEGLPVYVSFIENLNYKKKYVKLWIKIVEDIDLVIDSL